MRTYYVCFPGKLDQFLSVKIFADFYPFNYALIRAGVAVHRPLVRIVLLLNDKKDDAMLGFLNKSVCLLTAYEMSRSPGGY